MRFTCAFPCTLAVRVLAAAIFIQACGTCGFALGQKQYVELTQRPGDFVFAHRKSLATLYVDPNDHAGVLHAVNNLQSDIARVTSRTPPLASSLSKLSANSIIVGTIGKSAVIDRLIAEKKIDVSAIQGKWESFLIQVVTKPVAGVTTGLVIVGSDKDRKSTRLNSSHVD